MAKSKPPPKGDDEEQDEPSKGDVQRGFLPKGDSEERAAVIDARHGITGSRWLGRGRNRK